MSFKYFLVVVLISFIFYLLLLPRLGLVRKGAIFTVVLTMLVFAVHPDWTTDVAHHVGVSRGVDLLFYLAHLMLLFVAFVYFLRFKKMEARLTKLVRQIALERARTNS